MVGAIIGILVAFVVLVVLLVLNDKHQKSRKKQEEAKQQSDVFLETDNVKYFGKFFKKTNGDVVLKFHLLEKCIGSQLSDPYFIYMGFVVTNKDKKVIADEKYSAIEEYKEGEMRIGTSDVKSVKKASQIDISLNVPAKEINENGELNISVDVVGSVSKAGMAYDEKIANWKISKKFN